jgi:hypothetical protein
VPLSILQFRDVRSCAWDRPGGLGGIPMPTLTIEYQGDQERLALEQAIAFFTQMRQVAQTAPAGTVLAACEQVAVEQGRTLLRKSLAAAVQTRLDVADQKRGRRGTGAARVATPASPAGDTAAPS